ncbi:YcjF family protein [Acholeplasma sp. OttesenSCG-928-E16]|nr:YcjF family protein [Acholeplasma sp. OttesenSCG-928-E16]
MKKKKNPTRYLWYLVAIGFFIIFFVVLISSVISLGERIANWTHPYVSYGFYLLVAVIVWFLILNPVRIVVFSPSFSIETTLDKDSRKNYRVYKKVAHRLIDGDVISDNEKEKLRFALKDGYDNLRLALNHTLDSSLKKEINKKIRKSAVTVMVSTAISQNGKLDAFTIISVNFKMIKDIVSMCGFRPSFKNLSKLTVNVFTTALIADGIENVDLNDFLPQSTMNLFAEIPLVKPLISSTVQGITNGLLTLRIGVVTRKYLFSDVKETSKDIIRRGAFIESTKMLPSVVGDAFKGFPKRFANLFKGKDKKEAAESF